MVAEETTIEVRVMHFNIRMCKVVFPGGHHLVIGGRLVSSAKDGVTTPHPDLPAYTMEMFPVPFIPWMENHGDISVSVLKDGKMKSLGPVRSSTLLFNTRSAEAVREWIRSQRC